MTTNKIYHLLQFAILKSEIKQDKQARGRMNQEGPLACPHLAEICGLLLRNLIMSCLT